MLKTRIIPTLLSRSGALVKGRGFHANRVVGHVLQAARVHQMRGVDEIVVLDIAATPEGRGPDTGLIADLTAECFMPVTVGGGVRSVDDIRDLLRAGADKVAINTAAVRTPGIVQEAAERFGSQAVVISIDVRAGEVSTRCGTEATGLDPVAWAREVERLGAGEIILCAVERDGTMAGYDREMIAKVSQAVRIPVVASGGCSGYPDMADVLETTEAHGLGVGALFQFCDATPKGAAEYLAGRGFAMRVAA
ncbi:MAG: imidazole glycerol phosphate synthase cyclase subunit [Hyphomicrobiales bacterium]|nr:imidazole glycerol phosphate synthase cyclase subunit [Hyphomicrobiales bacterium]